MTSITGPNPETIFPIKDYYKLVFLKNFVKSKNIIIGDYTYFDDRDVDQKNLRNTTSFTTTISQR